MTDPKGMLSLDSLRTLVSSGKIETVIVAFTDLYGRFMGKRFEAGYFLCGVAEQGTHACDYLLTVDMEMDPVRGYRFANWERGYGDFHLVPDFDTLRLADWLDKTAMVICDVHNESLHEPVSIAPRSLLNHQVEQVAQAGFAAKSGSELEYYIFRNSYREAAQSGFRPLEPAGWYIEDYHMFQGAREESFNAAVRRHLVASGVPVECTKGEWGKGRHELNVRYSDVRTMGDRHAIHKQCLKEVADAQQISVTFMAKFSEDQAGSSCHVHLSLWDFPQANNNAFVGDQSLAPIQCSDQFRWFGGGD